MNVAEEINASLTSSVTIIKSVNQSSTRVASNHVLQCHVVRQQALESRIEEENREGSRVLLLGRGRQRRA